MNMSLLILKLLLTAYILYALFEFLGFLFKKEDPSMKKLEGIFENGGEKKIRTFDNIVLLIMVVFVTLLFVSGVEYLSFTTGLIVGMAILMTYNHRFSDPLPAEKFPKPPITALKLMTYSIHANPKKAWRELIFMVLLFSWALYMLATEGFGWF